MSELRRRAEEENDDLINEIENIIKEVAKEYPYKVKGEPETYNKYNEGWSDACDVLGSKILEEAKLIEL